ncbi:MAG: hypothetical protein KDJ19_14340, partial [Hyphomicrobiaceae bacterium]|nr:hypothetical protein [Hyphomicrobiaceae bacterium]
MPEKHTKMTHEYEPLPDDSVPGFGDLGLFDAMVHFITGFGVRTVRDSEWSDFDGSSLSKTIKAKASPFKGFTMLVVGTGLSVDGSGQPDAGQISYIQFIDGNANPAGLVNFSEPIQITDFISTAKAGSGKVHASNYKDFFNLVAPGTVTSNGTSESEKFQGNKGDD